MTTDQAPAILKALCAKLGRTRQRKVIAMLPILAEIMAGNAHVKRET